MEGNEDPKRKHVERAQKSLLLYLACYFCPEKPKKIRNLHEAEQNEARLDAAITLMQL